MAIHYLLNSANNLQLFNDHVFTCYMYVCTYIHILLYMSIRYVLLFLYKLDKAFFDE